MPEREQQAAEEESVPAVAAEADNVADVVEVVDAVAEVDMRLVVDTEAVD